MRKSDFRAIQDFDLPASCHQYTPIKGFIQPLVVRFLQAHVLPGFYGINFIQNHIEAIEGCIVRYVT